MDVNIRPRKMLQEVLVTSSGVLSEDVDKTPLVNLPDVESRKPVLPTSAGVISEPPIAATSEIPKLFDTAGVGSPESSEQPGQPEPEPVKVRLHIAQTKQPTDKSKENIIAGLVEGSKVPSGAKVKTSHHQPTEPNIQQQKKRPQGGKPFYKPTPSKAARAKPNKSALLHAPGSGPPSLQEQRSVSSALQPKTRHPLPAQQSGKVLHTSHLYKRSVIMSKAPSYSSGNPNSLPRDPRPVRQVPGNNFHPAHGSPSLMPARIEDWTTWGELSIKVSNIPLEATTKDLWMAFKKEGQIVTIEIFEDATGRRDGYGRVRFSPPPPYAFWHQPSYGIQLGESAAKAPVRLQLESQRRKFTPLNLIDPEKRYAETILLNASCIDFGFMYAPEIMMAMYRVLPGPRSAVSFRVNLHHKEIDVSFQINIEDPRVRAWKQSQKNAENPTPIPLHYGKLDRIENICFKIPFAQPLAVHEISKGKQTILLISMETPPNFYRKYGEAHTHDQDSNFWSHMHAWFRQTDLLYDPKKLKIAPLALKKSGSIIDIGRWVTYRFELHLDQEGQKMYDSVREALKDFNVEITPLPGFTLMTDRKPAVWDYIDKGLPKKNRKSNRHDLADLFDDTEVQQMSFPIRYQLEVCISQGYLNEHNITKDFVEKLLTMNQDEARDLLEYVANEKKRIYRPVEILDLKIVQDLKLRRIPHYCVYMRSATITPSTVYYNTPTVETSNRVVRQYAQYGDRFLRVRFTDEKFQGRIFYTDKETMNEVFTRIKRAMINGIQIGDRHFEFLAFGNSQFREHGAYFFAPLTDLTCDDIRKWMGDFQAIKVVAKYAARLGQCFSTTRAITGTKVTLVTIPDIQKGKFVFTDGVGKISNFLAVMAASELGLTMSSDEPPSVYQFRLGGCKGVLALDPKLQTREIQIRSSQYKFPAKHQGLEIIRWSKFAAAYLNRQLILVLSTLQVPDEVFINKLREQLSNLALAMRDPEMALSMLQKEIDPNQMTLSLAAMVLEGFQTVREPFMLSLLKLWRAWSIKYLKEKAKILVNGGALLFGCIDETATLQGHFYDRQPKPMDTREERINLLPEIFVQLSKGKDDKPEVIVGPMLLARNPSLHPGDIRVVRGVDVLALRHLKDVVVLPQTGDRDLSGMCSGGDLDGDDYLVMWDQDILPPEDQWNHEPMDYTAPVPIEVPEVTTNDITSFFVTYIKNDSLPQIAHAHLATADFMDDGVMNEKCLLLATLHSKAVDYVKTGEPAIMPADLRPRRWPHFMEKKHKAKEQVYVSKKVLGQLYDQVELVDFVPEYSAPFDKRILQAYDVGDQLLSDATEVKMQYDAAMYRIMAQHDIATEFEVWSTFVMHHANMSKDFKFHEEMGEIATTLKDRFRGICYEKAGGKDFDKIGPFVVAMYKVASEETKRALAECREIHMVSGKMTPVREMEVKSMPLMSFPWLFQSVLGKIANGELHVPDQATVGTADILRTHLKKHPPKQLLAEMDLLGDEIETAEGVTHRGDVLKLFQDAPQRSEGDAYAGLGDLLKSEKPIALDAPKPATTLENQLIDTASATSEARPETSIPIETTSDNNTLIPGIHESTPDGPSSLLDLDIDVAENGKDDSPTAQASTQSSPFELLDSRIPTELADSGIMVPEDDDSWTSALDVGTPGSPITNEVLDAASRTPTQSGYESQISLDTIPDAVEESLLLPFAVHRESSASVDRVAFVQPHNSSDHSMEHRKFSPSMLKSDSSIRQEKTPDPVTDLLTEPENKTLDSEPTVQFEYTANDSTPVEEDNDVPIDAPLDVQWAALWKKPRKSSTQLPKGHVSSEPPVNTTDDTSGSTRKLVEKTKDAVVVSQGNQTLASTLHSQIHSTRTSISGNGVASAIVSNDKVAAPSREKKQLVSAKRKGDEKPEIVPPSPFLHTLASLELSKDLEKEYLVQTTTQKMPRLPDLNHDHVVGATSSGVLNTSTNRKKRRVATQSLDQQKLATLRLTAGRPMEDMKPYPDTQISSMSKSIDEQPKELVLNKEKQKAVSPDLSWNYAGFDDWLVGREGKASNSQPSQRLPSLPTIPGASAGLGLSLIDFQDIDEIEEGIEPESSVAEHVISPLPSGSHDLSMSAPEIPETEDGSGVVQEMELEDVFKDISSLSKGKQKLRIYDNPSPFKPSTVNDPGEAPVYRFGERPGTPSPQRQATGKSRMEIEGSDYGDFGDVSALDRLEEHEITEEVFITPPEGPNALEKLANLIDF
ncbi:MAG: hypothetical protein MMC33_005784 [Icmadophila ericetorum]|nr:hypothetical protein [Icmadophila ericetorum]